MGHREALLEGAIECLQTKGYSRTTARDLTALSGANLRSIGYHFGSKERLLNEALIEAFRRWLTPVVTAIAGLKPQDPVHQLALALTELLRSLEAKRPLLVSWFEALAQAERSEELRARMAESYDHFRRVVSDAIQTAFIPRRPEHLDGIEPNLAASLLIALFDGLAVQWMVDPGNAPDPDAMVSALGRLFDQVVRATSG
jgi:AcrR family transcriptional regulator